MNNDQKLLALIQKTDSLLKALDKVDETNGASIYKEKARAERRELKIWLAGNRMVTVVDQTAAKQLKTSYNRRQNWLGR